MTDFIVTGNTEIQTVISERETILTLQSESENIQTILSESSNIQTLLSESQAIQVLSSVTQGPPGIRGPAGAAGGTSIELTAAIDLGGNRVVTGNSVYADNTDLATIGKVIGLTIGAVTSGLPVSIVANGELDGFSGLEINAPIYLSVNGTTTQALPATGYLQKLGIAISATKILIRINEPLAL